jgi:cytochrome P450 family 150 subfamily A5
VAELLDTNFFGDRAVQDDPYRYYAALRSVSQIYREPHYGVFMVTGYDAGIAVYNDSKQFSSCNVVSGPFVPFPVPLEGDDVSDIIEEHRDMLPFSDQLPSFDPPKHTAHRGLMMRLLTPRRLRENEEFMGRFADRLLDDIVAQGRADFVSDYAGPFAQLVIADLEGVPEADHALFAEGLRRVAAEVSHKPLEFLYEQFSRYIEDRRVDPRADIMTEMATATFADGTTPSVHDVALLAANLFTGGQETTVRMLSFAVRILAEDQALQRRLRDERELIPNFIEEVLRYESPLRAQFRMARVHTSVAGIDIPAGSSLLLLPGACNRDPKMFEQPDVFDVDRKNAIYHLTFGHGAHHCAGAHLARAEGRVTLNRLFDRTSSIMIDETVHGPAEARRYQFLPTYFLRGLRHLGVLVTPN